jgi:threonine/homoserine/homoserine lactone efflux protein
MLTDLLPLASYCLVMSGTPGPNTVLLHFGYRRTLPHGLGISAGVAVQTFLCAFGLGTLFTAFPIVQHVLRWVGAGYLVWLAWRLAMMPVGGRGEAGGRPMSFWEGAAFQAVNPKTWLKAITIGSVFLPVGVAPLPAAALVTAIGFAVGYPCITAWTLFGMALRRWLQQPRERRRFNAIMGGALFVLALQMLLPP